VKILSLRITQHFTDEVDRVLNLVVGTRFPSFDDDCRINHVACSQYVKLQIFVGLQSHKGGWGSQIVLEVFECLLCFLGPLELVLFYKELEKWEPPNAES
jgi:hypothetical protein